ncbi:hypothetical protein [Granulicoccus sp. GXG6511]|uniref:hypothetical protein n=1 Tax=Granulicoccus sp. GXG6511 TaxID=3381351 RepID=UPI003D7D7A96
MNRITAVKRRLTRRNIAAVIVAFVVLLAAGGLEGLFDRYFGPDAWGTRFQNVNVGVGDVVDVDGVRASVLSVGSAYRVADATDERVANGIFIVVRLRGEFHTTGANDMSELAARYSDDVPTDVAAGRPPQVATGFWEERTVAFDVDPDRLEGLRVTIAQVETTFRYRTRAVVDLGIDEARAAELRAVGVEDMLELPPENMAALA